MPGRILSPWPHRLQIFLAMLLALCLCACGSKTPRHKGGVPGAAPYTVKGKRYYPLKSAEGFVQEGTASWYGPKFHGRKTSSGEIYNQWGMTAAHTILPLHTKVRVTNLANGRTCIVRINDRGPFVGDRVIDLSRAAAHKVGILGAGTGRVRIHALTPERRHEPSPETEPKPAGPVLQPAQVPQSLPEPVPGEGSYGLPADAGGAFAGRVQVGSFASQENAGRAVQALEREGLGSEVTRTPSGLWKVEACRFADSEARERAFRRLQLLFPGAFLVD